LGVVVALGGLLNMALFWGLEELTLRIGAGLTVFENAIESGAWVTVTGYSILCVAIALLGFYASTLTHNLLQAFLAALIAALIAALGLPLCGGAVVYLESWLGFLVGNDSSLPALVEGVTLAVAILWVSFDNFRHPFDLGRVCRHNLLAIVGALLVSMFLS